MGDLPKVSIVIVNLNGRYLLPECINSIKKLNYSKDKVQIVVVDNGSTDGSVELLRKKYANVKLVLNQKNEGFAKPSNDGARAADGEYVAFLNNDMRVEKDWLIELVNSIREQNAQCAASLIMSWNGDMLDFAGGSVNFYGLGYQYDFHVPVSQINVEFGSDREILFGCGGAMLVDRKLFLDAGGFDEDYFAYFEDVDFGWRFTLLGNKTVLSVKSRVRHKHNGTSSRIAKERIRKLCCRNNLYTIYKNYGDEIFNRVMLPSIMLNLHEAFKTSEIDLENYDIRSNAEFDSSPVRINHMAALELAALDDFARDMPKMWQKRQKIQSRRKISDNVLLNFITDPFIIFPGETADFINTKYDFIKAFKLDEAFKTEFKTKILLVTGDSAKTEHFTTMAKAFVPDGFEVTLCCPGDVKADKIAFIPFEGYDGEKLLFTASAAHIVIADGAEDEGQLEKLAEASRGKYVIADITGIDISGDSESNLSQLDSILKLGDYIICADDEQKKKWQTLLKTAQKLNPDAYTFNKAYIDIFASVSTDNGTKPLIEFCKKPSHLVREEISQNSDTEIVDNEGDDEDGAMLGGRADRRLAEIERQQKSIAELLKKNVGTAVETQRDVKEVLEQSNLMNSRFLKLKSSLIKFKLFSRFFK